MYKLRNIEFPQKDKNEIVKDKFLSFLGKDISVNTDNTWAITKLASFILENTNLSEETCWLSMPKEKIKIIEKYWNTYTQLDSFTDWLSEDRSLFESPRNYTLFEIEEEQKKAQYEYPYLFWALAPLDKDGWGNIYKTIFRCKEYLQQQNILLISLHIFKRKEIKDINTVYDHAIAELAKGFRTPDASCYHTEPFSLNEEAIKKKLEKYFLYNPQNLEIDSGIKRLPTETIIAYPLKNAEKNIFRIFNQKDL